MTQRRKKSESSVQSTVRLDVSTEYGTVTHRNNVGAFKTSTGQWVRYGLANESKEMNKRVKSSDLIGWTPVVITPEMVGKTIAVYTALETKEEGYKPSGVKQIEHYEAQQRFCGIVAKAGGISGIVDSGKAALDVIKKWLQWANS